LDEQAALRADKAQLTTSLSAQQAIVTSLETELAEVRKELNTAIKTKRELAAQFDSLSALKLSADREMEERASLLRRQLLQTQQQLETLKAKYETPALVATAIDSDVSTSPTPQQEQPAAAAERELGSCTL
jgi:predicted RNase H-like nuclease (RuvC/YqgF family)